MMADLMGVQGVLVDDKREDVDNLRYMVGELATEENYKLDHPRVKCVEIRMGDKQYGCDEEVRVVDLACQNRISWWKVLKEV